MPKENNNMQVDIENLFKQNVNDLSAIKELYRKLKEVEEKITQIKYIDNNLANKLKKEYESLIKTISEDYESLKCVILDENIQAKLANDIKTITNQVFVESFHGNDDDKIRQAIEHAATTNAVVKFANKKYTTTKPIKLYKNTKLEGASLIATTTSKSTQIENVTTNMFEFNDNILTDVNLIGIHFSGKNDRTLHCFYNDYEKHLKWGVISNCGFSKFDRVFYNTTLTGMKIYDVEIDAINSVGVLVGSDNMIDRLFISTNNSTKRCESLIEFKNFMLSSISRMFMTGSLSVGYGAINMIKISGNSHTLQFNNNWFDYVDGSALMITSTSDGTPSGIDFNCNSFRGICRDVNKSTSMIKVFGGKNINFNGNGFIKVHIGDEISKNVKIADLNKIEINNKIIKSTNISFLNNSYDISNNLFGYNSDNSENIIINEPSLNMFNEIFKNGTLYKNGLSIVDLNNYHVKLTTTIKANSFYNIAINQNIVTINYNDNLLIKSITKSVSGIIYELKNTINGIYLSLNNITESDINITPFSFDFEVVKNINV